MHTLTAPFTNLLAGLLAAIAAGITALLAIPRLRRFVVRHRWWFVGAATVALGFVFLVWLPGRYDPRDFPDSYLPGFFRRGYWGWVYLFLLAATASAVALVGLLRTPRVPVTAVERGAEQTELDAAWEEILVQLGQAGIAPEGQQVVLILAPDEASAGALVQSAGLQTFAQAPAHEAPIHAFATSDGLLLSCAGASSFGSGAGGPSSALEHLCRILRALAPEEPVVRAILLALPIPWASRTESVREAAALRDDLQTIRRVLKVRCPVFAVFTGMETVPGFAAYVARLCAQVSPLMAEKRAGFEVPPSHEFSGDLAQRGLSWMSGWFHNWMLNLLAGDLHDYAGNAQLVTLDGEFRRYRKRLRQVLEAALATHRESEPVLFRGCYFVADGPGRGERAFAPGLLRGPRSRVIADRLDADWTDEALRLDRRHGRVALGLAALGALLVLPPWLYIAAHAPYHLGWLGLIGLVAMWAIVLLRIEWP